MGQKYRCEYCGRLFEIANDEQKLIDSGKVRRMEPLCSRFCYDEYFGSGADGKRIVIEGYGRDGKPVKVLMWHEGEAPSESQLTTKVDHVREYSAEDKARAKQERGRGAYSEGATQTILPSERLKYGLRVSFPARDDA